jgi:pimeloyl-ACP methyl ester carboxylesterase
VAPSAFGLAAAGFHAVAPDMRGYGQTDRPEAIDQYTLIHLVGDMVGLLDALGEETDRNWQLLASFAGSKIRVPAFLIAGDHDIVLAFSGMDQIIANLPKNVPKLQGILILPRCGH